MAYLELLIMVLIYSSLSSFVCSTLDNAIEIHWRAIGKSRVSRM